MNHELLCTWLGLEKAAWPPEPRTLVGLRPDENDPVFIEKRVQDRMAKLRGYQLSYPEEATEGMNRLAEAFIALTDMRNKPQDSAIMNAAPVCTKEVKNAVPVQADWSDAPPVRQDGPDAPEPINSPDSAVEILIAQPFAPPVKPTPRAIDPSLLRELAEHSDDATCSLATLEAVIERVDRTRILLHAWERLEKPLKGSSKKISAKESETFGVRLDKVAQAMQAYPAILGQPGKPGYRVVVQARLRMPLAMVRGLGDDQRDELLADWHAGRQILLLHRKYLRRLFKSMRHRGPVGLFLHAVRAMMNDYPLWAVGGAVLLIAVVASVVIMRR